MFNSNHGYKISLLKIILFLAYHLMKLVTKRQLKFVNLKEIYKFCQQEIRQKSVRKVLISQEDKKQGLA